MSADETKFLVSSKQLAAARTFLKDATRIAVLTGAGVSKESGIATFREDQTGLWARYDPFELASPEGFKRDPALVWRWYDERRKNLARVEPNPAHYAIAEMEAKFSHFTVMTQNVDGLHLRAGSRNVLELHGNITSFHCFDRKHIAKDVPLGLLEPPVCHCGSLIRPSVVWFNEALNKTVLRQAWLAAQECQVIFVVGTSALVQPAASIPLEAKHAGARIIEVNRQATALTPSVDLFIGANAGAVMPVLLQLMI